MCNVCCLVLYCNSAHVQTQKVPGTAGFTVVHVYYHIEMRRVLFREQAGIQILFKNPSIRCGKSYVNLISSS